MTSPLANLGRRLAATTTAEQWLAVEDDADAGARFAAADRLLAEAVAAALAGTAPVQVTGDSERRQVTAKHLPAAARAALGTLFDLDAQRATGAWWLPEVATLYPGKINLPAYYTTEPRWAMNTASALSGRVTVVGSPTALACWALLAPFADALYAPLLLRGPQAGALEPEARDAAWDAVATSYTALGLTGPAVTAALDRMRPGSGWTRLATAEQTAIKVALVDALRDAVGADTVRRWRTEALRPLVTRFYAKAKKDTPTAKAVLTKALQPAVSGYFAGNWLAVLDYLEEAPAPGEEITTALPEPRLYVQASAKVQQVAAEQNMPVEAVAEVLASLFGSDEVRSPVERRLEVLRGYWAFVDDAHARQTSGMPPLDDLASGSGFGIPEQAPFPAPAYERLLPTTTLAEMDALWGGECLPRYPDRIVSALFPHANMTAAFAPAMPFWHGLALTCWYFCEGPSSRTDIDGMAEYYARDVAALAAAGIPVDPQLFADLRASQRHLGPPEQIWADTREIAPGIVIRTGGGTRRAGFEILRDILTTHRRAWAAAHLETALRLSWERPLREVARQVNLAVARRGKLPTAKQFAALGHTVADEWFGGDLSALYAAVGEKPPIEQRRVRLMPYDRARFCTEVFTALGGRFVPNSHAAADYDGNELSWVVRRLAGEAPRFVQLEEALDRAPTEQEMRAARLTWPEGLTFERFAAVVREVRAGLPITRPTGATSQTTPAVASRSETTNVVASRPPVPTSRPVMPAPDRHGPTFAQAPTPRPQPAPVVQPAPARETEPALPVEGPATGSPAHAAAADVSMRSRRPSLLGRLVGRRQEVPPASPPAGWYADPHVPGQLRWWDGAAWTQHLQSS